MLKFITPPDAAIFTGLLGIIMVLAGREISGAIVVSASVFSFVYMQMATSEESRNSATNFMRDVYWRGRYIARRVICQKETHAVRDERYHLEMADLDQQRQINRYR